MSFLLSDVIVLLGCLEFCVKVPIAQLFYLFATVFELSFDNLVKVINSLILLWFKGDHIRSSLISTFDVPELFKHLSNGVFI